jgi:hypothetical protein
MVIFLFWMYKRGDKTMRKELVFSVRKGSKGQEWLAVHGKALESKL